MLAVVLAGCSRQATLTAKAGSVYRYPLRFEPVTLDPACLNETPSQELLQNIFEGLVSFDSNNRIAPRLAEKWDISPDGKTYTFHLRRTARFHNGRSFTSSDVKYSLERALWRETKSGVAATYLAGIEGSAEAAAGSRRDLPGISTPDATTVVIRVTRPRGYFLGELAYPTAWVVCREAIERNGGILDEKALVGTGPFTLSSYRHGYGFTLAANKDYWGGRPKLDRIERPIIRDPQTAHIRYENGELDSTAISAADYLRDKNSSSLRDQAHLLPSANTLFVVMHPRLQPVYADRRVRRAIAMAVNKHDMVRIASQGIWSRADSFLPPGFPGFNPQFRRIEYDPNGAKRLLGEAGFPGGRGFPELTFVYGQSNPEVGAVAQMLRDNLRQNLGITVNLRESEPATLRTDIFAQKVAFTITDWAPDYIDPQNFLSMLLRTGSRLNFSGYSNPAFDSLCDRADAMNDMANRIPLYQRADQIAMEDVAILPLVYANGRILMKPYVRDWSYNLISGVPQDKTWIDKRR
jgi:ABC-type transport system substrate-binding protein